MDYPMFGQIELFAFTFAPYNWHLCDGSLLTVQQYQALYALIGTTYGGNGTTNFALPNLIGTEPIPTMKYYISLDGLWPPRD